MPLPSLCSLTDSGISIATNRSMSLVMGHPPYCDGNGNGELTGLTALPLPLSVYFAQTSQKNPVECQSNQGTPLLQAPQELPISLGIRARISRHHPICPLPPPPCPLPHISPPHPPLWPPYHSRPHRLSGSLPLPHLYDPHLFKNLDSSVANLPQPLFHTTLHSLIFSSTQLSNVHLFCSFILLPVSSHCHASSVRACGCALGGPLRPQCLHRSVSGTE